MYTLHVFLNIGPHDVDVECNVKKPLRTKTVVPLVDKKRQRQRPLNNSKANMLPSKEKCPNPLPFI